MRRRGLEHRRKEAALSQLGDLQFQIPSLCGQQAAAMAVALGAAVLGALIAPRADRLSSLGLDQLLEHQLHRVADQARTATSAEGLPQLRCGSIRPGHRCVLLDE